MDFQFHDLPTVIISNQPGKRGQQNQGTTSVCLFPGTKSGRTNGINRHNLQEIDKFCNQNCTASDICHLQMDLPLLEPEPTILLKECSTYKEAAKTADRIN